MWGTPTPVWQRPSSRLPRCGLVPPGMGSRTLALDKPVHGGALCRVLCMDFILGRAGSWLSRSVMVFPVAQPAIGVLHLPRPALGVHLLDMRCLWVLHPLWLAFSLLAIPYGPAISRLCIRCAQRLLPRCDHPAEAHNLGLVHPALNAVIAVFNAECSDWPRIPSAFSMWT